MALDSYLCQTFCWNSLLINALFVNFDNNELTDTPPKALIKSNSPLLILLISFYTLTLGPTPISTALILILITPALLIF